MVRRTWRVRLPQTAPFSRPIGRSAGVLVVSSRSSKPCQTSPTLVTRSGNDNADANATHGTSELVNAAVS